MISAEMERRLRDAADKQGKDLDTFLGELLERPDASATTKAPAPAKKRPSWYVEPPELTDEEIEQGYKDLWALIERCQMHTGIPDLAQEYEHYLHGTPRQSEQPD